MFFKKKKSEEKQYISLIKKCITQGADSDDRTGVGTKSIFGEKMEFDIQTTIPVVTTRRTAFKTCIKELLWMISGSTDANVLKKQKCFIWNGNSTREFLDKRNLNHLSEGDIGAGYGFQLRHFGANYKTCSDDYTNQGFDQLSYVINEIKTNPSSRRILFTYWNPAALDKMALTPCHHTFQFNVEGDTLSGCLYQRSTDAVLGLPFNIIFYSTLIYMVAHITGLKPGKFIHFSGNTHVYKPHIPNALKQIKRKPLGFPTLEPFSKDITDISQFTLKDFVLKGYKHHPSLKYDMAV